FEERRARRGAGRRVRAADSREEARPRAGVAGHAVLMHLEQERVAIAVRVHAVDVLGVARRLALAPQNLARARPEMALAGPQCRIEGLAIHPGDHQHLAGLRLLDDGGNETVGPPAELFRAHVSSLT